MARKTIKFLACDRCPQGREQPATRTETISIGDSRWQLDLCEDCGRKLDRDLYSWGRLGTPVEERGSAEGQRIIASGYLFEAKRAAELRSKQVAEDRSRPAKGATVVTRVDLQDVLPPHAADWGFTDHARERLEERKIHVIDALRAATRPTVKRPGNKPNTVIHEANGVQVMLDINAKQILTVAHQPR